MEVKKMGRFIKLVSDSEALNQTPFYELSGLDLHCLHGHFCLKIEECKV